MKTKKYWLNTINTDKQIKKFKNKLESHYYHNEMSVLNARNSLYKNELKNKATIEEKIVGDFLWENSFYFKFQKGFFFPFHRIVDFYIPGKKIIIEVDGGYHRDIKWKDEQKDKIWGAKGYKTIRILNEDVVSGKFKSKLYLDLICG